MFSKRELEGTAIIDHRESPGVTAEQAAAMRCMPVGRGTRAELPTFTCSHCTCVVVMNPLRTRERGFCPKCDRYVCDRCEAARVASGGECYPFAKRIDDFMDEVAKGEPHGKTLSL